MTLGEKIRDCRIRAGLSQEKLAEHMDVTRQAVGKWETGQSAPSAENLQRLSDLFGESMTPPSVPELEAPAASAAGSCAASDDGDGACRNSLPPDASRDSPEPGRCMPAGSPAAGNSASSGFPAETVPAGPAPASQEPVASPPVSDTEPAALLELLHRERREQGLARKRRLQRWLTSFLLFCAAYLLLCFLGRIVWCGGQDTTVAGWLFTARPAGEHSYLFGWLLSSRLFWWAAAISALPSLFGKWKFSLVTLAGFVLGFFLGLVFGPNPAGEALGQGHYGWAIWGAVFLIACLAGGIVQKLRGKQ